MNAILLGYSGHGIVIAEAAIEMGVKIIGYCDNNSKTNNLFNLKYLNSENSKSYDWKICKSYILGLGSNELRQKMFEKVKKNNSNNVTVIHPKSSISKYINVGEGTFIARNVTVNPNVTIGNACILNTSVSVDHDCVLEDFVHIAPGVVLAGNVKVGTGAFIGANSVVKEGVKIGKNAIIGAGSVVLKDVKSGNTVYGNPAKNIIND